MSERHYKELARILVKNDIERATPERNALPIRFDGYPACRVELSVYVCIFPDDLKSSEADKLYHKVNPFFRAIKNRK